MWRVSNLPKITELVNDSNTGLLTPELKLLTISLYICAISQLLTSSPHAFSPLYCSLPPAFLLTRCLQPRLPFFLKTPYSALLGMMLPALPYSVRISLPSPCGCVTVDSLCPLCHRTSCLEILQDLD